MLKHAKNTSPLNQFKNLYFSDAGREELIELLNSKIYQIVNDSIFGYKKKINLKFLFSFCSQEFIISDSHIHTSELNPEKEMDDFLLLGSFYLNRNLKLYKELVQVFEEFDFDEIKLKPEIEKLSNFIIDKHLTPEVTQLILDYLSSSEKVGTVNERLRIYELRNGEYPLRLLNRKDLIEFLLFFVDNEINTSTSRSTSRRNQQIKKIDFESLVSEEVHKLIITLFKDLVFDCLEDGELYNVDFDNFVKLHAVGLISEQTTIKLFNKAINLSKTEDIRVRRIYDFLYNSFYDRYNSSFYLLTQEVLGDLNDCDLLDFLDNLSYLMKKLPTSSRSIEKIISDKIMPEFNGRKIKVHREFTVNEHSFIFLAFNFGDYFFNNFSSIRFKIKANKLVSFFFNLVQSTDKQIKFRKMIPLIQDAKNNGLSFKISEDAKENLELLIKSIDSGLSVSEEDHFNIFVKSFYEILD